MPELIVIGGSPGSGKSTLSAKLRAHLGGPAIDFGRLREFHLDWDWTNQSPAEESLAFDNLIYIIRNYLRHGYTNIIVDDLRDHRVQEIAGIFQDVRYCGLTLVVRDADELRRRIRARNEGWKDTEAAVAWNQQVIERAAVAGEYKIDTAAASPDDVFNEAIAILASVDV